MLAARRGISRLTRGPGQRPGGRWWRPGPDGQAL